MAAVALYFSCSILDGGIEGDNKLKIKAKDFTYQPLKTGMKLIFLIDKDTKKQISPHLYKFEDKPLELDINIDAQERLKQLNMISPEMRKFIYAIFNDINKKTGQGVESIKFEMKAMFVVGYPQYGDFSLADCPKELANKFINFLVTWCFQNEVALSVKPLDYVEDMELYLYICLREKICCVCGEHGEEHHVDAIGMGRNRNTVDDSENLKICLCGRHHRTGEDSAHNLGWETFMERFHVFGIKFDR